jgi:5-formyltetrahydrofolate cyclo-ligase
MIPDKKELRKLLLKQRSELSKEDCRKLSKIVCKYLTELDIYKQADTIFAYSSIRNEIACDYLIEKAISDGKKVALPRVISSDDDNEMQFFYCLEVENLEEGFMGISEPEEDYSNLAVPSEKTLIVLPGLAFGRNFGRIGYGKGFYDRYLSLYEENVQSVAVCYDFQLLDKVPTDEHDIPANVIITPSETLMRGEAL